MRKSASNQKRAISEPSFELPSSLCSFDGVDVANDGTVPFRRGERIAFSYLVSQRYTGETARLTILREGREHQVQVKLGSHNRLVPVHTGGKPPSYYIVAGETEPGKREVGERCMAVKLGSEESPRVVLYEGFVQPGTSYG